jgi:hypothetical protein
MPCDYSVRVEMGVSAQSGGRPRRAGVRKFIVEYNADGEPLRIKEIRELQKPQLGIYHANYWNAKSHPRTGLPARILDAAHAKQLAENAVANATP